MRLQPQSPARESTSRTLPLKLATPLLLLIAAIGCDKPEMEVPTPAAPSAAAIDSSPRAAPTAAIAPQAHKVASTTTTTKKRKPVAPAVVAAAPVPASTVNTRVFESDNYLVTIDDDRQEGDVTSDTVKYHCVSKVSGKRITLTGSTYHTWTKDGTPGHFLGYKFENGDTIYIVWETGELTVRQGNKTLVDETGTWHDKV